MKRPPGQGPLQRVRTMRHEATPPERNLWSLVRASEIDGAKFRRQVWIGAYIVDFVCLAARLVIEVDGDTHAGTQVADADRTAWLNREGFRVIRFTNANVMNKPDGVAAAIRHALILPPASPAGPSLSPSGEGC